MTYSEIHLPYITISFFTNNKELLFNYVKANGLIKSICGVNNFFESQVEATDLFEKISDFNTVVSDSDRREYGDFQTNNNLASQIANYAFSIYEDIEFILEPTCGRGNFIMASIIRSKRLKKVVGVEIYLPYVWETKFKVLNYFLGNNVSQKPDIDIIHANAFDFNYESLAKSTKHLKTLVIGNPPWITNSELGTIDSKNLPTKSNFKKHRGFDAITGKGNFDIGEYISLTLLSYFQNHTGLFSFLLKNSVIKNILYDQKRNYYRIGKSVKLNIDSKKEFGVAVNAALFLTNLNSEPEFTCTEYDFYSRKKVETFGWYKNKFVYSVENYDKSNIIDGKSKFIWRSGVKHDCSQVMELEKINGHFKNNLGEEVNLEQNLVYGFLKSSDLKKDYINTFRKVTIVTQKKIGQETKYIEEEFPLTYRYLKSHKPLFEKRKSSIYVDKPDYSIFGVGDYSFAKYKVAISGFYKSTHFTLVKPNDSKPIMLDDTCYFIGFNELKIAEIAHYLLNSDLVQNFLKSIIFSDSKRSINKDVLMRIDFEKAFESSDYNSAKERIIGLTIDQWEEFGAILKVSVIEKLTLF